MRKDLIEKVLNDLKGIIPYAQNIVWEDCHSTSYMGRYYFKKNKIVISDYITDEQDYMSTVAHELIHSCGVHGHKEEFKKYMSIINSLNLGYSVHTNATKDNGINEIRKKRLANRQERKRYITWCKCCGASWITLRKHHKISAWRCAKCGGKLGQKLYKDGVTIKWRKN